MWAAFTPRFMTLVPIHNCLLAAALFCMVRAMSSPHSLLIEVAVRTHRASAFEDNPRSTLHLQQVEMNELQFSIADVASLTARGSIKSLFAENTLAVARLNASTVCGLFITRIV